jgi:hypothetical protein
VAISFNAAIGHAAPIEATSAAASANREIDALATGIPF